jgi:FAD/FMN-containing dehydrogenase
MMETKDIILKKLAAVVGEKHVTSDPEKAALYSQDQSFAPRRTPHYVAFPRSTTEVQEVVKLANEHRVPIVPRSSAVSLHGASIPTEGGILLDLTRMNRIIEINERNWYAIIEPGVTFLQLQAQLQSYGFRVAGAFLDPPSASVVSSYMERNPVVTAADFTYGIEHVISYTVVAPTGETFTVGHPPLENTPAGAPDGPGLNFFRIFQGAQGTLGIVTWMVIRVLPLPGAQKVFFFPCSSIERTVEIIRQIQKSELGLECFALNDFNMAALLLKEATGQAKLMKKGKYIGLRGASPWPKAQLQQFIDLRKTLPPWTVVICLSAVGPIPGDKIAYQELDLKEAAAEIGAVPKPTVGDMADLDKLILEELLLPWRMQKRFGFRGSCQQVMFSSGPDRAGEFNETVSRVAQKFLYPVEDIGIYLLPMERARGFYCSYDFHCNLADREESIRVSNLFDKLSEALVDMGAFFDRPYGRWAQMMFGRAGTYTEYLKRIKRELDPNNIMNPGKLCF